MTYTELKEARERIIKGCKFVLAYMTDDVKWKSHTGELAVKKLRDLLDSVSQVETVEVEDTGDLITLQTKINENT